MWSTVQRHISITELGNGELFMGFTAWEVIHSVAITVKGKKNKHSPAVTCFIMVLYAEGRMEWDLMNFKVELFSASDTKDFTCFLYFLLYKHDTMACFWEFHLFVWVMHVHLILSISPESLDWISTHLLSISQNGITKYSGQLHLLR